MGPREKHSDNEGKAVIENTKAKHVQTVEQTASYEDAQVRALAGQRLTRGEALAVARRFAWPNGQTRALWTLAIGGIPPAAEVLADLSDVVAYALITAEDERAALALSSWVRAHAFHPVEEGA